MNYIVLDMILVRSIVKNIVGIMGLDIVITVPMIKSLQKDVR